jgi:hypothetical protein
MTANATRPQMTLPESSIRNWAIKDFVSREAIPDDADELQLGAGIRGQVETMRTYAQHALRLYAKSVYIDPKTITDEERAAAAVAIATRAAEMRRKLADGEQVLTGITPDRLTARQLATDVEVVSQLKAGIPF